MKAMQEGCWVTHMPWGPGKITALPATITCLGPLATVREKRARSVLSFPFSLSADANTQIFGLLLCLPMLHYSKYLQQTQCFPKEGEPSPP